MTVRKVNDIKESGFYLDSVEAGFSLIEEWFDYSKEVEEESVGFTMLCRFMCVHLNIIASLSVICSL